MRCSPLARIAGSPLVRPGRSCDSDGEWTASAGGQVPSIVLDAFAVVVEPSASLKLGVEGAELRSLTDTQRLLVSRGPVIVHELHSPNQQAVRELLPVYQVEDLDSPYRLIAVPYDRDS